MRLTWKTVNKWFNLKETVRGRYIESKMEAKTPQEALEKTLCKWILIEEHGYFGGGVASTCGFCNYYTCHICPLCEKQGYGKFDCMMGRDCGTVSMNIYLDYLMRKDNAL